MTYSRGEIALGGIVLAAAMAFLIYAAGLTGFGANSGGQFTLQASFRSADGVAVGTDVRLAGVKIGAVTAMDLNPVTYRAETHLRSQTALKSPMIVQSQLNLRAFLAVTSSIFPPVGQSSTLLAAMRLKTPKAPLV